MKILPYKLASKSAKLLAKHLGCKRIRPNTNTYRHTSGRLVVNWGCENQRSTIPTKDYLNAPAAVRLASNKLSCFQRLYLRGVPTLGWSESKTYMQECLDNMTARTTGKTVKRYNRKGKLFISKWDSPEDQVTWMIDLEKPGAYSVNINYSAPIGGEGSKFIFSLPD